MSRLPALLVAVFAWALLQGPAFAQVFSEDGAPSRSISVPMNKSVAFRLSSDATKVVVAQPEIAQVVANTDQSVYVRGMSMGATNVLVYGRGGRLVEVIDVNVGHDATSAQTDINRALPNEKIIVTNLGESLVLSGEASTNTAAQRAQIIAERYAPKQVISEVYVTGAQQVVLEVRIVEASRNALKDFGVGLAIGGGRAGLLTGGQVVEPLVEGTVNSNLYGVNTAAGRIGIRTNVGGTSIDAYIDAMEDKGLVRTLARPNLAAMSGEEASFLAGGEFPFPVPEGDEGVTIEFKPFGVQLKFTPTVQTNGLIKLKVAPEVSQLDNSQPLRINGFDVPSITIRRTATTIELKDGETFAVAGLYQQEYANGVRQIPGLGDIPILGALFRSSRWRRRETELVVLVTPRLMTASESRAATPDPLRINNEPTAIDLILSGSNFDLPMETPVGGRPGPQP